MLGHQLVFAVVQNIGIILGGGGAEGAQAPHFSSFYCFGNALVLLINFETLFRKICALKMHQNQYLSIHLLKIFPGNIK